MAGHRSAPGYEGTSIEALSWIEPDVPGVWVVATESGTRYVIAVPPEGVAVVTRQAFYGWSFDWQPLHSACAYVGEALDEPLRVGAEALVAYAGPGRYVRSTKVIRIDSYELAALFTLSRLQEFAESLMRADAARLVRDAYDDGRITSSEQLADVCRAIGISVDSVLDRPSGSN